MTLRQSILIGLFAATSLHGQQPKNVKILVGFSRPEVQRIMNQMRAGLGVHCHYCHVVGQDPSFDGTPQKERAREMMRMVIDLNQRNFGGRDVVTCYTCHNGTPHPKLSPPLPQALPRDVTANPPVAETKKFPSPPEVLQRYIAAVGRIVPAAEPRTIIATRATPLGGPVAMKVLESREQWRADITLPDGTPVTQVLTGSGGWIRDKSGVRDMSSEELAGARMGRRPFAPFTESSFGDDARVTSEKIGDQNVWVVTTPDAQYSFDAESALLVRRVVFYNSPVGRIPEQTEFDHYRSVGGAKVPFTTRVALVDPWLGGTRQATTIVIGKPISLTEFEKPSLSRRSDTHKLAIPTL
jgi:photosynthetic reaction center cytochrome c subunit